MAGPSTHPPGIFLLFPSDRKREISGAGELQEQRPWRHRAGEKGAGWPATSAPLRDFNRPIEDLRLRLEENVSAYVFAKESLRSLEIQPAVLGVPGKRVLLRRKRIFVGLEQNTFSAIYSFATESILLIKY